MLETLRRLYTLMESAVTNKNLGQAGDIRSHCAQTGDLGAVGGPRSADAALEDPAGR